MTSSVFSLIPESGLWSSADVMSVTGGNAYEKWIAFGVTIDSREVKKGDLFIAIKGEKTDGHLFVEMALKNGAVAAIVDHVPSGIDPKKILIVKDTFVALQSLGCAARARTAAKIIGVTGSVGKTGTKEMLVHVFEKLGKTHGSIKSYNNHFGVPLSLARMSAGNDFGVFEMGMDHANEILPLTKMVRPHIAIITTIATSHIENFSDGIEGIARAKAEIFAGLDEHGIVIVNHDNPEYDFLMAEAKKNNINKIFSFGQHKEADARIINLIAASNGVRVNAKILGEECIFTLKDAGEHNAMNALSVLLAFKLMGGNMSDAVIALGDMEPPVGRGKREYLNIGDVNNPVTLIDECYNASSSITMHAAFKVLALIDPGRGGRRIAILGDMYEQGKDAAAIHRELAMPLQAAGIDLVYTCGPLMRNLYDALPEKKRGMHSNESQELAKIVPDVLVPGDVVMVKGSRGGGDKPRMQVIVEAMRKLPKNSKIAANNIKQERS
ncbi:MAG: UDP-N-acetylmuramoyl-tripeptide--D-alanyl-D-alanine ligase [Pseudomonadota bacterium]